jgi:hypothetical protein
MRVSLAWGNFANSGKRISERVASYFPTPTNWKSLSTGINKSFVFIIIPRSFGF